MDDAWDAMHAVDRWTAIAEAKVETIIAATIHGRPATLPTPPRSEAAPITLSTDLQKSVVALLNQPLAALRLAELTPRSQLIRDLLAADYGEGVVRIIPRYRGPDTGHIAITIHAAPADDPQQLCDQVRAALDRVLPGCPGIDISVA